mgnify:CR=1 FL=1
MTINPTHIDRGTSQLAGLERKLDLFTPSQYLSLSVHLDGLEPEHDFAVCREGVYRRVHRAIRATLARGFRVTTNTTLFDGADPEAVAAARSDWKSVTAAGLSATYWAQEDGRWVRKAGT